MRASLHSLGCKVNACETEAMAAQLSAAGFEIVPFGDEADVCVINTCTVTNIADRKSRQMLHRAKEADPDTLVVAVGCYVEERDGKVYKDPLVDIAVGNSDKERIAEIITGWLAEHGGSYGSAGEVPAGTVETAVFENAAEENSEGTGSAAFVGAERSDPEDGGHFTSELGRTRAYIKIEDGCNQFCTYCVIPHVRGRVTSRDAGAVIEEAEKLAEAGCREIVLTGIHISSYGLDIDHPGEVLQTPYASEAVTNRRLLELTEKLSEIRGIDRIRFGSLEPGIMSEEFVREIASNAKICPQFHLSLQSGSDRVLAAMRRKYTTADYLRICGTLREHYERPAITTDIIAGFPGETDEMFSETCAFVEKVGFARIHVFPYSARKGTYASVMPSQVAPSVKRSRAAVLRYIGAASAQAYASAFTGSEADVLFEETIIKNGAELLTGHTAEMLRVSCPSGGPFEAGDMVKCRIISAFEGECGGKCLEKH